MQLDKGGCMPVRRNFETNLKWAWLKSHDKGLNSNNVVEADYIKIIKILSPFALF